MGLRARFAALLMLAAVLPVAAQTGKPIRLVVPFGPGTSTDIVSRAVGDELGKALGASYASAGNGTSGHLAGALLEARLGGQAVHVPYKEGGQALTEGMAGQPLFMFYHPAAVLPHIKSGKLRALGASSARRSAAAPDVPTLQEQGVADFDLVAWFMLYAPAATPQPVLAKLREAAARALANPALKDRLSGQGIETRPMNAQEMAEFGLREAAKWAEAVRTSGAQVD